MGALLEWSGELEAGRPSPADYVLLRLSALWPGKVARKLGTDEEVDAWCRELDEAIARHRFTKVDVDAGINRAVAVLEWPPLDIHALIRLFSPVHDFEAAFKEARANAYALQLGDVVKWSHPALYFAADRFGWFPLRNAAYEHERERWETVLLEVLAWGQWPEPVTQYLPTEGGLQTRRVQLSALALAREKIRRAAAAGPVVHPGFEVKSKDI